MNKIDIAWLAGIAEGEAYIGVYHHQKYTNRRPSIRLSIKMADKDVIENVAKLFGASVWTKEDNRSPIFSTCYETRVTGQKAENILLAILPLMGKRRTAKIIECLSTPNLSHHPREKRIT